MNIVIPYEYAVLSGTLALAIFVYMAFHDSKFKVKLRTRLSTIATVWMAFYGLVTAIVLILRSIT